MRERLTLAFLGVALALLALVGVVRGAAVADSVRDTELAELGEHATQVASILDQRYANGLPVSSLTLQDMTRSDMELTVTRDGHEVMDTKGDLFAPESIGDEPLVVSRTVGETTVDAVRSDAEVDAITSGRWTSLLLVMLVAVLAVVLVGLVSARRFSQPFADLARSAEALGRGRFDIALPESRIPEVVALGAALRSSAQNLQHQFTRNRETAQLASHALRTPLTGMRLEIEDVLLREDLDEDARRSLVRCLADVARLQEIAGQLVDAERSRGLVGGTTVPLGEVADAVTERWDKLLQPGCRLRTSVVTGGDLHVTPGPVEQVLDSVLADVGAHGTGPVTVDLGAEETHVRIQVVAAPGRGAGADRSDALVGESTTTMLGGRWHGDALADGLEILLPRR